VLNFAVARSHSFSARASSLVIQKKCLVCGKLQKYARDLLKSSSPKLVIWSRDTCQGIPSFGSCQMSFETMSNIKDVPTELFLILAYRRSRDNQNFLHRWVTKFSKVWGSARTPSARRSSAKI